MSMPSLYERLGGAEKIASIASEIVDRHCANPKLQARFADSDVDVLKKNTTDFFILGAGGQAEYTGRDMPTVHGGMNIDEAELVAALDDVMAALDTHDVDPVSRNEVLGILYSLKGEVLFK